jgi:hypothetical protein
VWRLETEFADLAVPGSEIHVYSCHVLVSSLLGAEDSVTFNNCAWQLQGALQVDPFVVKIEFAQHQKSFWALVTLDISRRILRIESQQAV